MYRKKIIIPSILLWIISLSYLSSPMQEVYFDSLTSRYLMDNGYFIKISIMIVLLVLIFIITLYFNKGITKYLLLILSGSTIIFLIYDYIYIIPRLDLPFYSNLMLYKPFANSLNNPVNWVIITSIILMLSVIEYKKEY